jgi:predicted DNA-binding transcriptional regulator AlpA
MNTMFQSSKYDFIHEKTAAEILHKSQATLRTWRVKGTGPRYYKIGGKVLYRANDLEAWIERQARSSTSNIA